MSAQPCGSRGWRAGWPALLLCKALGLAAAPACAPSEAHRQMVGASPLHGLPQISAWIATPRPASVGRMRRRRMAWQSP